MPTRIRRALLAALAAALALPAVAHASGGASIASAPMLVYGQLESGGGLEDEFWRLPLYSGDLVTMQAEIPNSLTTFELLSPSVNDYSIGDANSAARDKGFAEDRIGKVEFTLRSPFTGLGTLAVCLRNGSSCTDIHGFPLEPYTFTATVAHATTVAISAPTLTARGQTITVAASVTSPAGTPAGNCLIDSTTAPLSAGRCSASVHLGFGRSQTIAVSFIGNNGWQSTQAHQGIRLTTPQSEHQTTHHHRHGHRRHGLRGKASTGRQP